MDRDKRSILERLEARRKLADACDYPNVKQRRARLKKLLSLIIEHQDAAMKALHADLGKSEFEALSTELLPLTGILRYLVRRLPGLARPALTGVSWMNFPASGRIVPEPYGLVLVVATWNYPLLLALERAVVLCLLARRNEKRLRGLFAGIVERSADRGQAEDAVEEVLARENPKFERHLSTISTLGGAAPLLGLLGTVLGMIQLFDVITRYGTSDPKLLAGGIAVALVTTQMGLMVAIPVMLLHNALANRADLLSARTEEAAIAALNARFGSEKR